MDRRQHKVIKMTKKFEISELGNRIIVKTKNNEEVTKITPLIYKKALKTIMNLQAEGKQVKLMEQTQNYLINSLF